MENKKPEELMALIPVEIRHHFVLRKRFIDYRHMILLRLKVLQAARMLQIVSRIKDPNSISYN